MSEEVPEGADLPDPGNGIEFEGVADFDEVECEEKEEVH